MAKKKQAKKPAKSSISRGKTGKVTVQTVPAKKAAAGSAASVTAGERPVTEIMTAEQASEYLQVSRSSIYKLTQHREIPYTRVGSSLRFMKSQLDRHLREKMVWPHQSLLDEFELLYERFHLKKFLRAKGIEYEDLSDDELVEQLQQAIEDLRQAERGADG